MQPKSLALILCLGWAPFCAYATGSDRPPVAAPVAPLATPSAGPAVPVAGRVTRAVLTSDVKNLEPVDNVSSMSNDHTRIHYFTEIQGMAGQAVTHRWEYNGKILFEKPFKVGALRWRIYSAKTLDPAWLGEWKASVVDAAGGSLSVNTFTYMKKPDAAR